MAGVLSLTELFNQRAETGIANSLIDASLYSLESTSLVKNLTDMKSGNKAIRDRKVQYIYIYINNKYVY